MKTTIAITSLLLIAAIAGVLIFKNKAPATKAAVLEPGLQTALNTPFNRLTLKKTELPNTISSTITGVKKTVDTQPSNAPSLSADLTTTKKKYQLYTGQR